MGDVLSCVRHAVRKRFFVLYEDFLDIADKDYKQACTHRVLETKTNDRLTYLREQGIDDPGIDDLWITLERNDFRSRSLGLYDGRSYYEALKSMERKKFVKKRYIKVDRDGEPVLDEQGNLLVYTTYRQAQKDRQHSGAILPQYLYCYWNVNNEISKCNPDEPPSPFDDGPSDGDADEIEEDEGKELAEEGEENEATEHGDQPSNPHNRPREGNPQTQGGSLVSSIVSKGSAKFPGGMTNGLQGAGKNTDPPGHFSNPLGNSANRPREDVPTPVSNFSSNKNLLQESNSRIPESTESAPDGAVETFSFENIWSYEAILNLAAIWLPPLPTHLRHEQLEDNQQKWEEAARKLLTDPSFTCYEPEQAITRFVRQMRYMTDPTSPCSWRRFMSANYPGTTVKLWHVANNATKIGQEMDQYAWYPEDEQVEEEENGWYPPEDDQVQDLVEEDHDPEPVMTPELSLPHTEPLMDEPEVLPSGMDAYEADQLVARIRGQRPLWITNRRRHGTGYLVEVQMSNNQIKHLYSPADWQTLQEASRLSFQERVARARASRSQFQKAG